MAPVSAGAKVYVALTVFTGLLLLIATCWQWQSVDLIRYLMYFFGSILASNLKVRLPGVTGTMSVSFTFIMMGVMELTLPQTLTIACIATLAQVLWRTTARPSLAQVAFNLSSITIAAELAFLAYHSGTIKLIDPTVPILLLVGTMVFYLANTLSIAGIIALTEGKSIWDVWRDSFLWAAPQYLAGAALAALIHYQNRYFGWQSTILTMPVIYLVYRSYGLYLGRLEEEKRHASELADLHWRTIEALALAIEAKDDTTHQHLRRVRVYATDIGKLAVPEYIISKPGKLTPEEFEKMKIHPAVGADILERVGFPYPVVPIVRAHHEKWNGTGYPLGLKQTAIPIGARILSAVDCLDALASERQYRRALPLHQAMEIVNAQSGTSFDPDVVSILNRRYIDLERQAVNSVGTEPKPSPADLTTDTNAGPDSGFESSGKSAPEAKHGDFLSSIAAARHEFQMLLEVTSELGNSLNLDGTLSLLAARLKQMVPHDCIAIYIVENDCLTPQIVQGEDSKMIAGLRIPVGQGLSGWVVENCKPIVNGNPSVEPGYLNDATKFSTLRSAISLPLEGPSGVVGALTLYSLEADFFTREHLRILLAISTKAGLTITNALRFKKLEQTSTTDDLTSLPNARALIVHLDKELTAAKMDQSSVTVLVLDFDGFKQVNDRFGHFTGNRILRQFGERAKVALRETDYIARMGGDEFVVVLTGSRVRDLTARIQTLQTLVVDIGLEVCHEDIVSLSVGSAHYPEDGADAEQLLAIADRQMYAAKNHHYSNVALSYQPLERTLVSIQ